MRNGEIVNVWGYYIKKAREFLGIISRALVSSTYLMRSRQSDSSLFVITVKRITPSLVPWGTPRFSVCNIHIFLSFLGSLLKQCTLFEIFLQFSLSPPYTKLKLGKILDTRTRPTLFVGWGEGVEPVCIGNRPRNAKMSQDFCPWL